MASLVACMRHKYDKAVSSRVLAFDASPWGKGVVHANGPMEIIRYYIRYHERWRFKQEYHHRLDMLGEFLHGFSE
eukprot:9404694-Karenia_brevis.AAC.1